MRTKTLLMAVAAFAAGITISNAQVYSANVVGYASVPIPNGGTYLITVPFNVGSSNGANEIWPGTTLPDFSQLLVWNPNTFAYIGYYSDSSSPSGWDDLSFSPISAPTLPVGQGFFLIPSADMTNVFSGAIAVNVGSSNKVTIANGTYALVAPAVPYQGAVTNGNPVTGAGGVGLSAANGLPDFSQLLIWNPNTFSYDGFYSDSSSPSGWDDLSFTPLGSAPSVSVGQAFFLVPSDNFTWKVGL